MEEMLPQCWPKCRRTVTIWVTANFLNAEVEQAGRPCFVRHDSQVAEARPYWWSVDGPDIWNELMEAAFPDQESDA